MHALHTNMLVSRDDGSRYLKRFRSCTDLLRDRSDQITEVG